MRIDNRKSHELRPVSFETSYLDHLPSSVLTSFGKTRVLCTAMVEDRVPPHREKSGGGWLSAEYGMLPASTSTRKSRNVTKVDGRSVEIQRLIGRSLRQAINIDLIGPRTIAIDCDVIQADAGTRTAAITGGYVALALCVQDLIKKGLIISPLEKVLLRQVAAVSLGIQKGDVLVDLCYEEDSRADTDFNLVGTHEGEIVEFQGSAESKPMTQAQIDLIFKVGSKAILELCAAQKEAILGSL